MEASTVALGGPAADGMEHANGGQPAVRQRFRNLHLYRLSPLVRAAETSVLHLAAGQHCVALATSSNTVLLLHSGGGHGPPMTRQVQWFAGALKGIASMDMRNDDDLLIATHDASAFVLPLRFMLRRPSLPVGAAAAQSAPADDAPPIAPSCPELIAVHGDGSHANVSCCALCEMQSAGGSAAAIGSLDGTVVLISLAKRYVVSKINVGAPISRLWSLPDSSTSSDPPPAATVASAATSAAAASTSGTATAACSSSAEEAPPGTPTSNPEPAATAGGSAEPSHLPPSGGSGGGNAVGTCDCLLARTLQGKYLLASLVAPVGVVTWRPLALPRGELTVQRAPPPTSLSASSSSSDGQMSHSHGPLLLLHCVDEARLLVYTTSLLSGGRHRPIFAFQLPGRTLPGSVHVGRHAILCAQEHAGGLRALVLSRHLAEEGAAPAGRRGSGVAERHAALRSLLPHAIMQSTPLPKGTVMIVAPLADGPSLSFGDPQTLGHLLFASRSALYALKPWCRPADICRRLLRRRSPQALAPHASTSVDHDVAYRSGLAWILARTFALDFDALSARANADALIRAASPVHARSSAAASTTVAAATCNVGAAAATTAAAADTFSPRGMALLFSYLGIAAAGNRPSAAAERRGVDEGEVAASSQLTNESMAALQSYLTPYGLDGSMGGLSGGVDAPREAIGEAPEGEEEEAAARRSASRVDLARLCCHLHAQLTLGHTSTKDFDAVAAAALASAPFTAARILATTGRWQSLLFLLPASEVEGAVATLLGSNAHASPRAPSFRTRLEWLRTAAAHGALSLAQPGLVPPHQWARLLAAIEPDGADGHMPGDGKPVVAPGVDCSGSRQCADTRMLLTLALLPPPDNESRTGDRASFGSGALGGSAAALGGALEVFLQYWVRQQWPRAPLVETLRAQMRGASLALCWLLEHRPEMVEQAALGPELLLDAIRVVACPVPSAPVS